MPKGYSVSFTVILRSKSCREGVWGQEAIAQSLAGHQSVGGRVGGCLCTTWLRSFLFPSLIKLLYLASLVFLPLLWLFCALSCWVGGGGAAVVLGWVIPGHPGGS